MKKLLTSFTLYINFMTHKRQHICTDELAVM